MKVIVADDSRVMRKIINNVVESLGHDPVEAINGQHVMEILNSDDSIGLVLLDWNMPMLNGLEVIKNMQNDDRFRTIPIVMVSTESERKNITEALKAGAKNYITKPFTPQDLASKIQDTLNRI